MGVPEHKKEIKTMSQEKIDRYKQEKANRKKNMKKQRMMGWARKGALTLAGLALVGLRQVFFEQEPGYYDGEL